MAPPPLAASADRPTTTKRRTEYERAAQPGAHRPSPEAPKPATWIPGPDDPFASRQPVRPPLNPDDPFRPSPGGWTTGTPAPIQGSRTPEPPPPAPTAAPPTWGGAPAPAPNNSRTIIESGGPAPQVHQVRGALFEYRSPADPGRIHPLHAGRNKIGRTAESDVVLEDGRVSSEHGFLMIVGDRATFMDVSTNGSIVDGRPVHGEVRELNPGSVLTLGGARLVFVLVPQAALEARLA